MADRSFRNECQENYIYFLKWKLFGIGVTRQDLSIPDSYPGINILRVLITDNPVTEYLMPIFFQTGINIDSNIVPRLPRINFNINCSNLDSISNSKFTEHRLLDTGSNYSTIPFLDKWNYETGISYRNESIGSGRYSFNCSTLNNNIENVDILPLETGAGDALFKKLTWKDPLLCSIGDLFPIRVKYMIVPVKYTPNLNIIGFDIISKHIMILSSKGMEIDIKFFSSEHSDSFEETFTNKFSSSIKSVSRHFGIFNLEDEF